MNYRKEQLWPELDLILRGEDDGNSVSTPYTAAIPEYRVVIHGRSNGDASYDNNHECVANGDASYDVHHPCRYSILFVCGYPSDKFTDWLNIYFSEESMLLSRENFTPPNLTALAFTWSLIYLEPA